MNRRRLVLAAAALALAPRVAAARPKRIVMFYGEAQATASEVLRVTTDALAAEGFAPGRDVELEMVAVTVWAERARLADGILSRRPDLIATRGTDLTVLMQQRTREVPIVFRNVGDPVAAGLVQSLARPGGNITGESNQSFVLEGKRLELLRELRPGLRRVAIVTTAGPAMTLAGQHQLRQAAALGIQVEELVLSGDRAADDFAHIPARLEAVKADGVVFQAFDVDHPTAPALLQSLAARGLPALFLDRRMVVRGGLASLTMREDYAVAAAIMARILRGAAPGTIPVELVTRTHLALNLRAARAMKLVIPDSVRLRADELIE